MCSVFQDYSFLYTVKFIKLIYCNDFLKDRNRRIPEPESFHEREETPQIYLVAVLQLGAL